MSRNYAGIGSRKTPIDVCEEMTAYAEVLSALGFVLRSGGAIRADQAFEKGAGGRDHIFLPNDEHPLWTEVFTMHFRPQPEKLSAFGWQAMCRNAMQVLGNYGNDPVEFVICWTSNGKDSGGTGQAIRIAKAFDIPVFNLYNKEDKDNLILLLHKLYKEVHDAN